MTRRPTFSVAAGIHAVVAAFFAVLHAIAAVRAEPAARGALAVGARVGAVVALFVRRLQGAIPATRAKAALWRTLVVAAVILAVVAVFARIDRAIAATTGVDAAGATAGGSIVDAVIALFIAVLLAIATVRRQLTIGAALAVGV